MGCWDIRNKFKCKVELTHLKILIYIYQSLLSQLPQMKLQAKTAYQTFRKNQISMPNQPENLGKLLFNNSIESKLSNIINFTKDNQKYRNTCLVENLQLLQSVPYSCFKQYELKNTPRKTARRKEKKIIDPIEQALLKEAHISRIQQWKARFISKKGDSGKPSLQQKFNRTKSLISKKALQSQYLGLKSHTYKTIDSKANQKHLPNTIIKDKQEKNMATNNVYMRRLKTKLQFYSLSSIISQRKDDEKSGGLSPYVTSIDQKYSTIQHPSEITNKISLKNTRSYTKKNKSIKLKFQNKNKTKLIQQLDCRPWSGIKGELTNDLNSFI